MFSGPTLDGARRLDVRTILRWFQKQPPSRFTFAVMQWPDGGSIGASLTGKTMALDYHADGVPVREELLLVSTACRFGGSRKWACCPNCGARRAVFYLAQGTFGRFVCRACLGWPYGSTRERDGLRALRRAKTVQSHVGDESAPYWTPLPRPHLQRLRTFARLEAKHRAAVLEFLDAAHEHAQAYRRGFERGFGRVRRTATAQAVT